MMTVKQLRELTYNLPDDMEVGVETSEEHDDLDGHEIESGYVMDFGDDDTPSKVFLLCIDRDRGKSALPRWTPKEREPIPDPRAAVSNVHS